MRNTMKRALSLSISGIISLSLILTGCGSKEATRPANDKKEEKKVLEPMKMTVAVRDTANPTKEKYIISSVKKAIKEKLNIDLDYEFVDKNTYNEKVNVWFASGTAPDVIYMNESARISQALEAKTVIDLTDAISKDPVWSKIDKVYFEQLNLGGKIAGIPSNRGYAYTFHYRSDWAQKVGAKEPTTVDELYQMMSDFTKKDPDGNGKDDTFGFSFVGGDLLFADPFWKMFLPQTPLNGGLYYDEKDKTVKSVLYLVDDMKKTLNWFKKAYSDGVLDKQFLTAKSDDVKNKLYSSKMGVYANEPMWVSQYEEKIKANTPTAQLAVLPAIKGSYGSCYTAFPSKSDGYFLTKNVKDVERGRQFMLTFYGPEVMSIQNFGEEGTSYKKESGKVTWLDPELTKIISYGNAVSFLHDNVKLPESVPSLEKAMETAKKGTVNLTTVSGAESKTFVDKSADLKKMTNEKILKIILGEIDVSKYDELIPELKKVGMDKILEELNAARKK